MATGKTKSLGLNLWEPEDSVLRAEFNENSEKVDAVLGGLVQREQLAWGSYVGTGTYGADSPNSLTFPFVPKLVLIFGPQYNGASTLAKSVAALWQGVDTYVLSVCKQSNYNPVVTWDGNDVSWYFEESMSYGSPYMVQLNVPNATYRYIAIG